MAKINLLPWREELRKQRNKEFGIIAGIVAAIAVAIIIAISTYYGALIDRANDRNKYMQTKIAELDKKIKEIKELKAKKERLLRRIETIQQLQTNRTEIVHLFDELVRRLPDGVYLKSFEQKGENLSMKGIAESNTRVSEFVRNIDASEWMKAPKINEIKRNKKSALQTNDFIMNLKQSRPKALQSDEEGES